MDVVAKQLAETVTVGRLRILNSTAIKLISDNRIFAYFAEHSADVE